MTNLKMLKMPLVLALLLSMLTSACAQSTIRPTSFQSGQIQPGLILTSKVATSDGSACSDVFAACDKVVESKDIIIKKQSETIDFLAKEHERLTKPKQFWEEQWFWLIIGTVVGAGAAGVGFGLGK